MSKRLWSEEPLESWIQAHLFTPSVKHQRRGPGGTTFELDGNGPEEHRSDTSLCFFRKGAGVSREQEWKAQISPVYPSVAAKRLGVADEAAQTALAPLVAHVGGRIKRR